ncbi:MAG: hypothetical protein AAGL98_12505, partial [Planctomycetota bacterium]
MHEKLICSGVGFQPAIGPKGQILPCFGLRSNGRLEARPTLNQLFVGLSTTALAKSSRFIRNAADVSSSKLHGRMFTEDDD